MFIAPRISDLSYRERSEMSDDYVWMTIPEVRRNPEYALDRNQLRRLIKYKRQNGMQKCMSCMGRNWLFRKDLFEAWLIAYNAGEE